ncbi:MAG: tetratricopeptide repeat protein [Planctomycetes bacterium]|nr:tetratricopeptide repeat protein [Planctomycetota bacterium]
MTATLETPFDITTSPIPSFGALQTARAEVWANRHTLESFHKRVAALGTGGEEGRRKGLGLWILAEYAEAAAILDKAGDDIVSAFTLARCHMSLGNPAEALPIFERLSKQYPDEPKPRGGVLEARLELEASKDEAAAAANLSAALAKAPESFRESAEGRYLAGRALELARDYEAAVERYEACRELDPGHRANLFRLAWCAERSGQDDIALDGYWTLVRMVPADKAALVNLGILLEDLGRDQDAAACYDTITRHDATDARIRLFLGDAISGMSMYYDEDMERKEDRLNQILRIPITDFELSVRARNCLNKMNILVLGDLVKLTEQELLSYKNFGETSLNEIKEILGSKGLRLGMAREEAVRSIEATRRKTVTADPSDVLNKPVSDLELSIRARRTVETLGCLTVGDILQHSEEELLGMPNFGQTSLAELKQKLGELSLKLKTKNG